MTKIILPIPSIKRNGLQRLSALLFRRRLINSITNGSSLIQSAFATQRRFNLFAGESKSNCRNYSTLFSNATEALAFISRKNTGTKASKSTLTCNDAATSQSGLFSVAELRSSQHLRLMSRDAREQCDQYIELLRPYAAGKKPPSLVILDYVDTISDTLCRVIDTAELIRNVHPSGEFRQVAEYVTAELGSYMETLNQDPIVYNSLCRFNQRFVSKSHIDCHCKSSDRNTDSINDSEHTLCTDEQHRVAYLFQHEMELNGISLPMSVQSRVHSLKAQIHTQMMEFSRTLNDHSDVFTIPIGSRSQFNTIFSILPSPYFSRLEYIEQNAQSYVRIPSEFDIIDMIMRWIKNDSVRRQVFYAGNRIHATNIRILDELVTSRNELAQCMNFPSYSHFHVRSLLAKTPTNVIKFLKTLLKESKPRAAEELNVIKEFKRRDLLQDCNNSHESNFKKHPSSLRHTKNDAAPHSETNPDADDVVVQMWDCAYYMGLLKSYRLDLDNNTLASYFSLANCIQGIDLIMSSLFNVRVRRVHLQPGEDWTEVYSERIEDEVIKLEAYDETDHKPLGVVYLDLFLRPSKFRGAAAFVVRAAREIPRCMQEDTECINGSKHLNVSKHQYPRQYPVLTIVAAWPRPIASQPILLSHGCLQALFHEWGHATHHLLCQNQYQHLSGARGELDFVELPSTLFENFAWDYRVLSKFAFHHETHKVIPEQMVANLNSSRDMFFGLDTHLLVIQSLFDHYLFSNEMYDDELIKPSALHLNQLANDCGLKTSSSSLEDIKYAITSPSTKLYHSILKTFSLFPTTHLTLFPHANNNHLCHYGAGYYTYLMCRVYSTAIWSKYFANNPLDCESGQLYRNSILKYGGARDPDLILLDVLGADFQEKSIQYFIAEHVKGKN